MSEQRADKKGISANARSRKIAAKGVQSFQDVANVMSATIADVTTGDLAPSAANKLSAKVGKTLRGAGVKRDVMAVPSQHARVNKEAQRGEHAAKGGFFSAARSHGFSSTMRKGAKSEKARGSKSALMRISERSKRSC